MKKCTIGIIGIIVGVLAISAAFLSPWIAETISPPKPIEETAVNFAVRLKDAAVAKARGEKYVPKIAPEKDAADYVPPVIIGMGMLGMALGVMSLMKNERRLVGGAAVCLGIGAAVVQWSIIITSVILFLILVAIVLNAFDIDLG